MVMKTYSHLARYHKIPSDYDVATSDLLYYVRRGGFEVEVPLAEWYRRHQQGSPLRCEDWEAFRDPRETTYAKYTALQSAQESHLDRLLATADDRELSPGWQERLGRLFAPQRYPLHGFQMVASYIGQMAPSGRITIVAALQAADEVRRLQRVAYRMAQLRRIFPEFGADSRALWEKDSSWQPLRQAIERLLVTYDWAEALVALNLCLKPVVDRLFVTDLGRMARGRGDFLLAQMLAAFEEDCAWHRAWTAALLDLAGDSVPENRAVIDAWVARWRPIAEAAVEPLAAALEQPP